MAWVYIVECTDAAYYTGSTTNLEMRLWEHNETDFGANFTRKRRPVKLVYCAEAESIAVAFAREKQIQGWSRAKKLALIEGRLEDLPGLSRRRLPEGPSAGSGSEPVADE